MALRKTAEQKLSDIHAFVEAKQLENERRLEELEEEDKILHGRINSATRWFMGLLFSMNTTWAGFTAYFKLKG